jgi:16S rRNA (guanine527-N7)-methyltransferase
MSTALELRVFSVCQMNGIFLTDTQMMKLRAFVGMLLEWNAKINLVSRKDTENIWFSHVLHSLSLLFFVRLPEGYRVLDLGTGGGFPGIPLSIVRGDLNITLCDSTRKKTDAVQQMVQGLQLANVRVETGRAEDIARDASHRQAYDLVVARAVASLSDLIRWSRPLVKRGGGDDLKLITLKGGNLDDEIRDAQTKSKPLPVKIDVEDIVFEGSVELGLEEKKIVKVYF